MIERDRIEEYKHELKLIHDALAQTEFTTVTSLVLAYKELKAQNRDRDLKLFRKGIALGKESVETADCDHPLYYNAINVEHEFQQVWGKD